MLDMGFLPDLQRIINLLPKQRQNLMFSATFSNEIKKLAQTFMHEPVLIEVARRNAIADNVSQVVYEVSAEHKRAAVAHIIRARKLPQVIVFSNTKIGTSRLARELLKEGIKADAIHGDKSQKDRMIALEGFKNGTIEVLVATDVAARGLDIVELPCVINYDLPHSPEDYVHRIGRTGRAGASGDAISLMAPEEERYLIDIEKLTTIKVERRPLDGFHPGPRARHSADASERDRSYRPSREAPRVPSRAAPAAVEEWFMKPYEDPGEGGASELAAIGSSVAPATSREKPVGSRPVAALLGGGKKS